VENAGSFPAKAFEHSAHTAYDASMNTFACHMSGAVKPAICASFLLMNADNNLAVRLHQFSGEIDMRQVHGDGADLFESYRAMAETNGVDPDSDVLAPCRANRTPREED
jgi:hypothetical protein